MKTERGNFSPSPAYISIIQSAAQKLAPSDDRITDWHDTYVKSHSQRLALDLEIVSKHVQKARKVLECGSVPLVLTAALEEWGYDVTGCDIDPGRYAETVERTGLNVVKCDIEREPLPFPDESFDAVLFNELFEHLRINLIFTLSEVLRVLKPGGVLLLSTPNLRSYEGIKNFLLRNRAYSCLGDIYGQYEKLSAIGHMGHVREYTTVETVEFLERIGFSVEKLIFRGRYRTNFAQAVIRAMPGLSPYVTYVAKRGT